mmetsp:Transcript_63471/g.150406  ORF Transcript_63471/g.150406 Transcript_63471/m.150406 type:complete len:188 (-) Transcript_63471:259-822(-)
MPLTVTVPGIQDSKKLGEDEREALFDQLVATPGVRYATCAIDHEEIDRINILQATMVAMGRAVRSLVGAEELGAEEPRPTFVLVDGPKLPELDGVPGQAIVRGDDTEYLISAASVVAKVSRDRIVRDLAKNWPQYGMEVHKGYGTAAHMAAIHRHGPSPIHRMTFAPMKHMKPQKEAPKKRKGKGKT